MIQKLEINGVHAKVDEKLHKYVIKKIGKLDQYMSSHSRESAHAEVKLKEEKIKARIQHTCEVILFLPKDVITSKNTAPTMLAAIDNVEAKLKNQLKKHKETHEGRSRLHRRVIRRLRRSTS